ncbi:MAG: ATP-binding cassette domain-containing protein, partial [Clostridia bacterium]|nr:ATP-binding cassette domain-containing protein [Clostridia bacterium]
MIELKNITKTFDTADGRVNALQDVTLSIPDGDIYGIIGMSGAGKSTLVRCINLLETPTSGSVEIDGVDPAKLNGAELRALRREVTMIFQHFNLLQQKTVLKNVTFPLELSGLSKAEAKARAMEHLEVVGLKDR